VLTALAGHLTLPRPVQEPLAFLILESHDVMPEEIPSDGSDNSRFRTTLIRVMIVQVVALGLLLLLQLRYQP
jgi:hypothetical protein